MTSYFFFLWRNEWHKYIQRVVCKEVSRHQGCWWVLRNIILWYNTASHFRMFLNTRHSVLRTSNLLTLTISRTSGWSWILSQKLNLITIDELKFWKISTYFRRKQYQKLNKLSPKVYSLNVWRNFIKQFVSVSLSLFTTDRVHLSN